MDCAEVLREMVLGVGVGLLTDGARAAMLIAERSM